MKRLLFRFSVLILILVTGAPVALATTIVPLRFEEVVRQAGVVVEGTVTDLQVWPTGADIPPGAPAPRRSSREAPMGAPVEGGRSLFTEVTFQVDSQLGEPVGREIQFTLAGGSSGGETVKVFGMPTFQVGRRYIVMLRPDFTRTNVPVVGVSQGFFEISRDPQSGEEILLNAEGDIVLGVEEGRVALRHNPARARSATPRLGDPPTPDEGSGVQAATSPAVERYWTSTERPMRPADFLERVRTLREVQP